MSIPSSQQVYRFEVQPTISNDPRSLGYLNDAHASSHDQIKSIHCSDLYFLRGHLNQDQLAEIAERILHDPVTQQVHWQEYSISTEEASQVSTQEMLVEVTYRPGVTDPVAQQLLRATRMINNYEVDAASSGQRFVVRGENLTSDLIHQLAKQLFANAVIQNYALGRITPSFPQETIASGRVDRFQLGEMSTDQLLHLSQERRAALNLEEMQAIQSYCQREGRDLSDVEFEMIAQTWSEHCVHKTFKANVQVNNPNPEDRRFPQEYEHLFNQTIRAATHHLNKAWVLSAFRDNAGIIKFGEQHELSFKVETHNHPSAIEPFGGANTGIGGVIRDVIGVSAKPIAATNILCFGPQYQSADTLPDGVLHPRRIASGVVSGIQDYGNKMGIPTVNGAIYYDPGYTANPLVFCGCIGLAPRDFHPRDVQPGDHIIVLGGKTGRDGLRGATFSSMTMDAQTGEVSGASVQIGAPIVEKGLVDVLMEARDLRLYHAITDCGAGGLSSAVGEMASECGGEVQLADVPLKYPGLEPWEIWLSEAQERMVIAVPQQNLDALEELCEKYDVEITNIGEFNGSGRIRVYYQDQEVLDLDNQFLHHGIPQRKLQATIRTPKHPPGWLDPDVNYPSDNPEERFLRLLAYPNITSKESVIRVYDHEVQGGTVVKPLCGIMDDGPADGCVIKPLSVPDEQALVLAAGMNPEYGKQDPYQMTLHAIDEAVRNALCCGADPNQIAILDNFCWGDPTRPETMGDLVQAAQACYDGALRYGTPFISGKDSFNNEYLGSDGLRHAIPPTLLISAMGVIADWRLSLTSDLKQTGNLLYMVGYFAPRFGGSHHNLINGMPVIEEGMPVCHPETPEVYQKVFQANQAGWVLSAHDVSEGGLGVAAAEMAMGGRLGLVLWLDEFHAYREMFGETGGCILVEVSKQDQAAFEKHFRSQPMRLIGKVISDQSIEIMNGEKPWLKISMEDLLQAWKNQQIREVLA